MKSIPLKLAIAGVLTLGTAASAFAQSWYPNQTTAQPQYGSPSSVNPQDQSAYEAQQNQYNDARQRYEYQQQQYQNQTNAYQNRRDAYQNRRDAYDVQRGRYDADRDAYESQREAYDAQYGVGAWERRYGYGYYRSGRCERRFYSGHYVRVCRDRYGHYRVTP